jgi:hypothetical protein
MIVGLIADIRLAQWKANEWLYALGGASFAEAPN